MKKLLLAAVVVLIVGGLWYWKSHGLDDGNVQTNQNPPENQVEVFTYIDPLLDVTVATSASIGYAGKDVYASKTYEEIVTIAKAGCSKLVLPVSADDVEVDRERKLATFSFVEKGNYISFSLPYTSQEVRGACPANIRQQLEKI